MLAVNVKLVDLSVEGFADLARRTRDVDQDAAGVDLVYAKSMRPKPVGDAIDIVLRDAESFPEFLCGQPLVEIGRFLIVLLGDQSVKLPFLLGRALEYEEDVIDIEFVGYSSTIILEIRFGTCAATEPHSLRVINLLRNAVSDGCGASGGGERYLGLGQRYQQGKDSNEENGADVSHKLSCEPEDIWCNRAHPGNRAQQNSKVIILKIVFQNHHARIIMRESSFEKSSFENHRKGIDRRCMNWPETHLAKKYTGIESQRQEKSGPESG